MPGDIRPFQLTKRNRGSEDRSRAQPAWAPRPSEWHHHADGAAVDIVVIDAAIENQQPFRAKAEMPYGRRP